MGLNLGMAFQLSDDYLDYDIDDSSNNYGRETSKENLENKVRITTRFGSIDIRLFNDTPYHRANFIYLTKNKYFEGGHT